MQKIGRYQITRELGRGAMGVVYHAIDPVIGRPVAIKTLRLGDLDDGEQRKRLRERLFREARSAGALSHPGIVTIYDMDEVDGLAYIAMEYVDGETLETILGRKEPIVKERLLEVLRQAAAALDYAHRKGIIHRDIKPANIMIDTAGAVKITDFGIAKIAQLDGQTLTGVLIGTPNYMSPEQVRGNEIDGRSDQFSLAVIAYEMLAGERPFSGDQISTVVYKIVAEQPAPVQNVNSTLNETIDRALRRGMAKKGERRYPACTAFATALETALGNSKNWRVMARRARPGAALGATGAATRTVQAARRAKAEVPESARKEKRQTSWVLPFAGAFLVLLALLAVVAWQAGLLDPSPIREALGLEETSQVHPPAPPAASADSQMPAAAERNAPTLTATAAMADPLSSATEDRPSPMSPTSPQPVVEKQEAAAPIPPKPDASVESKRTAEPLPAGPVTFQDVSVMSNPAGATATLDPPGGGVCQTPCKLHARTGVHAMTISKEGFEAESREIRMAHEDVDLPLISLRASTGILLLTSEPSGAIVTIDSKTTGEATPVRVSLASGKHTVIVAKDGVQSSTQEVEIRKGDLSTLKLTFGPR